MMERRKSLAAPAFLVAAVSLVTPASVVAPESLAALYLAYFFIIFTKGQRPQHITHQTRARLAGGHATPLFGVAIIWHIALRVVLRRSRKLMATNTEYCTYET
jgi:hypothetical protein